MKTIKVSEATNTQLDWLVAKAEEKETILIPSQFYQGGELVFRGEYDWERDAHVEANYTTNPSLMWPLIEREKISVVCAEGDYNPKKSGTPDCYDTYWVAVMGRQTAQSSYGPQGDDWGMHFQIESTACSGPTPLIAAARCYVVSKLGETVEVPEEL